MCVLGRGRGRVAQLNWGNTNTACIVLELVLHGLVLSGDLVRPIDSTLAGNMVHSNLFSVYIVRCTSCHNQ